MENQLYHKTLILTNTPTTAPMVYFFQLVDNTTEAGYGGEDLCKNYETKVIQDRIFQTKQDDQKILCSIFRIAIKENRFRKKD